MYKRTKGRYILKKLFTTIGLVLVSALLIVSLKKGTSVKVVSNDKEQLNLDSDLASIETSIDKEEAQKYEKISEGLEAQIKNSREEINEFEKVSEIMEDKIRNYRNEIKEYKKVSEKLEDQIKNYRNEVKEYEKVSKGLEEQIKNSR